MLGTVNAALTESLASNDACDIDSLTAHKDTNWSSRPRDISISSFRPSPDLAAIGSWHAKNEHTPSAPMLDGIQQSASQKTPPVQLRCFFVLDFDNKKNTRSRFSGKSNLTRRDSMDLIANLL